MDQGVRVGTGVGVKGIPRMGVGVSGVGIHGVGVRGGGRTGVGVGASVGGRGGQIAVGTNGVGVGLLKM